MAEVTLDGVGTPVDEPNIVGAEVIILPGPTISSNANNPKEVEFGGVGNPVIDPNIVGAEVNTTPGGGYTGNATNPKEVEFGGFGPPVADGNNAQNPQFFDNKGINVTTGAMGSLPSNELFLGTTGIPVGDGNAADNPVTFDNRGKNVTVVPAPGPPIDTDTERTFTGRVINVGN